jgi:hypothetical protein
VKNRLVLLALACAGALALSGTASAAILRVDDDGAQCATAAFTSIQAAIDAAGPGQRIEVCPGTYTEQITVPAGKDGIDLYSRTKLTAVIKAPAVMADPGDVVRVNGAQDVIFRDFTIAGPLPSSLFCSLQVRTGVRVDGGGSATLLRNHITEIRSADPALRGCQNGIAVLVGRSSEGQVGTAILRDNEIDAYQKGGVMVDGAGSSALLDGNTVTGVGPTPVIAQNGIQISRGAVATVLLNTVQDNQYSLAPASGSDGVLLYQAGAGTVVDRNTIRRNDENIGLYSTSGVEILKNRIVTSAFWDGIYVDSASSGNHIHRNFLRGNAEHDCHDDSVGAGTSGTANTWDHNDGVTENKPGLCT